ncbi:MAG: hypothetical protein MUQ76_11890 [Reinekea forsetii]|nr:hypothetical protein [Reinekea forsetii]
MNELADRLANRAMDKMVKS